MQLWISALNDFLIKDQNLDLRSISIYGGVIWEPLGFYGATLDDRITPGDPG